MLTACEVILIVNKFFHKIYGNVKANKKAVADRGWYPANRALVLHPSLNRDRGKKGTNSDLNMEEGIAATSLDRLLAHQQRSEAGKKAADKRKARYEGFAEDMRDTKRLTAGLLVKNEIFP